MRRRRRFICSPDYLHAALERGCTGAKFKPDFRRQGEAGPAAAARNAKSCVQAEASVTLPFPPLIALWPQPCLVNMILDTAFAPNDAGITSTEDVIPSLHAVEGGASEDPSRPTPNCITLREPDMLVGFEGSWLESRAATLTLWDKLSLEPYGSPKPLLYYVLCPDYLVPMARMFFKELSSSFEGCKLGSHSAGPSISGLQSLSGIISVPSSPAPDPSMQQHNLDGGCSSFTTFHPVFGAVSNHASGFRPGLDSLLEQPLAARGVAGGPSGAAAVRPLGDAASKVLPPHVVAEASGSSEHYIRNLRFACDMLQRSLMLNPPPQLLPHSSGAGGLRDASGSGLVVYVLPPSDHPSAAAWALLEVAARLSPLTQASPLPESPPDDLDHAATPEVSAPVTPPYGGDAESINLTPAASDIEHLLEELQQLDRYGAAARHNYIPCHGATGFADKGGGGGSKGASSSRAKSRAVPTALDDISWQAVKVKLHVVDLENLRDVTGQAVRATAMAVYDKMRRLPHKLQLSSATHPWLQACSAPSDLPPPTNALDRCEPALTGTPEPQGASKPLSISHSGSINLLREPLVILATPCISQPTGDASSAPAPTAAAHHLSRATSASQGSHTDHLNAPSPWLPPPLPLSLPHAEALTNGAYPVESSTALPSSTAAAVSTSASSALHCAYAWWLPSGKHGEARHLWVCMSWTDSRGELLETKAVALPVRDGGSVPQCMPHGRAAASHCGPGTLGDGRAAVVGGEAEGCIGGSIGGASVVARKRLLSAYAPAISRLVLEECIAMYQDLCHVLAPKPEHTDAPGKDRNEGGRHADSAGGGPSVDVGVPRQQPLQPFDSVCVVKVCGSMEAEECSAWQALLPLRGAAAGHSQPGNPTISSSTPGCSRNPRVIVAFFDQFPVCLPCGLQLETLRDGAYAIELQEGTRKLGADRLSKQAASKELLAAPSSADYLLGAHRRGRVEGGIAHLKSRALLLSTPAAVAHLGGCCEPSSTPPVCIGLSLVLDTDPSCPLLVPLYEAAAPQQHRGLPPMSKPQLLRTSSTLPPLSPDPGATSSRSKSLPRPPSGREHEGRASSLPPAAASRQRVVSPAMCRKRSAPGSTERELLEDPAIDMAVGDAATSGRRGRSPADDAATQDEPMASTTTDTVGEGTEQGGSGNPRQRKRVWGRRADAPELDPQQELAGMDAAQLVPPSTALLTASPFSAAAPCDAVVSDAPLQLSMRPVPASIALCHELYSLSVLANVHKQLTGGFSCTVGGQLALTPGGTDGPALLLPLHCGVVQRMLRLVTRFEELGPTTGE